MQLKSFCALTGSVLFLWITVTGCMTGRHTQGAMAAVRTKTLIGEYDRGWIRYKVFQLPSSDTSATRSSKVTPVVFSIMVINMQDGVSPLRRLCHSLDQYNVYYEYLMNQTKNDLVLINGKTILYPVYYTFENNYNAFPFETINVGYQPDRRKKGKGSNEYSLLYIDRVFSHDSIRCNLTASSTSIQ